MKSALITGITGQDGSYLADILLEKGYRVFGVVRRTSTSDYWRINHLLRDEKITLVDGDLLDQSSLMKAVEASQPDEVYNLAAQSFVGTSWKQPTLTAEVTGLGALRMLEAVRAINPMIRFYQASTSELFGSSPPPQNEQTLFHPRSPYGVAKLFAHQTAINYRESYGMFVSCGILFNHESERRGLEFVTRKITYSAARIKAGLMTQLQLGNLEAKRDWSHAKDVMKAAWLMLQQEKPGDYVVGSGKAHSVREFADLTFSQLGLNYLHHVVIDPNLFRPAEVDYLLADTTLACEELNWQPEYSFGDLVREMVYSDYEKIPNVRTGGKHSEE